MSGTRSPWQPRTYGRCRLIQDQQLALADDRAGEGDDLPLSYRQVPTTTSNLGVQGEPALISEALEREQSGGAERIVQHGVVVLSEDVQVLA